MAKSHTFSLLLLLLAFFFTLTTARFISIVSIKDKEYEITIDGIDIKSARVTVKDCRTLELTVKLAESETSCDSTCNPATPKSTKTATACVFALTELCRDTKYDVTIGKTTKGFTTLPGDPKEVQEVKEEVVSAKEVKLSWKAPTCPRSSELTYQVINKDKVEPVPDNKLELTVDGLESSTEYEFTIKACLKRDQTKCSEVKSYKVMTDPDKPDSPKFQKSDLEAFKIRVTWEPLPPPTGKTVYYFYRAECSSTDKAPTTLRDLKRRTSIVYDKLKPGTMYYVFIQAYASGASSGKIIDGDVTKLTQIKTVAIAPTAPKNLKLDRTSSTSLTAKWERPETPNGDIDNYIVQITGGKEITLKGDTSTYVFDKLNPYTEYEVTVAAVNLVNKKQLPGPIESTTAFTLVDKPSQPVGLKVDQVEATKLILLWKAPNLPNGPSPKYDLTYTRVDSFQGDPAIEPSVNKGIDGTTIVIDSLMPYRKYKFTLQAYNIHDVTKEKLSGGSVEVVGTTATSAPHEPQNVKISLEESKKLLVSWDLDAPMTGPTTFTIEVKYASSTIEDPDCTKVKEWVVAKKEEDFGSTWKTVAWDNLEWVTMKCYQAIVTAVVEGHPGASGTSPPVRSPDATLVPDQPNSKQPMIIINTINQYLIITGDICKDGKGPLMKYLLSLAKQGSNQGFNPEMLQKYD